MAHEIGGHQTGLAIVQVDDIGLEADGLSSFENGTEEQREAQIVVRMVVAIGAHVEAVAIEERRTVDEIDRRRLILR